MGDSAGQRRQLGFWTCVALVMGNMIGASFFLLPSALASYGPISFLGWVFTGTGAVLLAVMFARLSRCVPAAGGPYAYTRMGLGDFPGFLVAWGYWNSIWVGNAAIAVAFIGYLAPLLPAVGSSAAVAAVAALGALWLLTGVNLLGMRAAGGVQVVTTALKVIPLVIFGTVGLLWVDPVNFTPFNVSGQSGFSAVTATAALTLWALLGLESATIPADDVQEPATTIPKATIVGTVLTAALYLAGTMAVMGVMATSELADSSAPFADAAALMWGDWARPVLALGVAVAGFGVLNGWILISGQIPLAAARDGLFPGRFAKLSHRGVPAFGLVLSSCLTTVLVAANFTRSLVSLFTFTVLLATMTAVVPYAFTALAQLILTDRDPERFGSLRGAGMTLVAILAFVYSVWAIAGSGQESVFWGFILLLAGGPVYVWMVRGRPRSELDP